MQLMVGPSASASVCASVCARVCVCVCVRACVRACVCVCVLHSSTENRLPGVEQDAVTEALYMI